MCKSISICVSYSYYMTYSVYDLFIVDCLYKNEFSHVVTIYTEGYCVHKELIDLCNSLWISSFFFCHFFISFFPLSLPSFHFFLPILSPISFNQDTFCYSLGTWTHDLWWSLLFWSIDVYSLHYLYWPHQTRSYMNTKRTSENLLLRD